MNKIRNNPEIWFLLLILFISFFGFGFLASSSIAVKWDISLNTLLALFIAAASFGAAFYQAYLVRVHNRIQVRPYLICQTSFKKLSDGSTCNVDLILKNVGLGPAIIKRFSISMDGKAVDFKNQTVKWVSHVRNIINSDKIKPVDGFLRVNSAIDKGQEFVVLGVTFPSGVGAYLGNRGLAIKIFDNISIEIDYECHYGEKSFLRETAVVVDT